MDVMVSGSEDCTLQLWDLKLFQQIEDDKMQQTIDFDIEPYLTLRGHHTCVLSTTKSPVND